MMTDETFLDARTVAELMRYLDSEGREGDIVIAGVPFPRLSPEHVRDTKAQGFVIAMVAVAYRFAERLAAETKWRIASLRAEGAEVVAEVDFGDIAREGAGGALQSDQGREESRGAQGPSAARTRASSSVGRASSSAGARIAGLKLRHRALELLMTDDGKPDPIVFGRERGPYLEKLDAVVAGAMVVVDVLRQTAVAGREVTDGEVERLAAESAGRWGAPEFAEEFRKIVAGKERARAEAPPPMTAEQLLSEVERYLASEGREGDIVIAGAAWPRLAPECLRTPGEHNILIAMTAVAHGLARRIAAETDWKLVSFRADGPAVYAEVDVGLGGGALTQLNLRNRALDLLTVDRETGKPDKRILGPENRKFYMEKLDNIIAGGMVIIDSVRYVTAERVRDREPSDDEVARFTAESARQWGARDLAFRWATGREGESEQEQLRRIEEKEWRPVLPPPGPDTKTRVRIWLDRLVERVDKEQRGVGR